jgi:hypothetical protein
MATVSYIGSTLKNMVMISKEAEKVKKLISNEIATQGQTTYFNQKAEGNPDYYDDDEHERRHAGGKKEGVNDMLLEQIGLLGSGTMVTFPTSDSQAELRFKQRLQMGSLEMKNPTRLADEDLAILDQTGPSRCDYSGHRVRRLLTRAHQVVHHKGLLTYLHCMVEGAATRRVHGGLAWLPRDWEALLVELFMGSESGRAWPRLLCK